MTQREQILTAILDRLNTGRPPGVPVAERLRFFDIEQLAEPVLVIVPTRESVRRAGHQRAVVVERQLTITANTYVRAASGPGSLAVDAAAESTLAWLTQALGGWTVPSLITDIEEAKTLWQYADLESPTARVTTEFVVTYQTRVNDAEQRA